MMDPEDHETPLLIPVSTVDWVMQLIAVRDDIRGGAVPDASPYYNPAADDVRIPVLWCEAIVAAIAEGHDLDTDELVQGAEAELSERHIALLLDRLTSPTLEPLRPRLEAVRAQLGQIPPTFLACLDGKIG